MVSVDESFPADLVTMPSSMASTACAHFMLVLRALLSLRRFVFVSHCQVLLYSSREDGSAYGDVLIYHNLVLTTIIITILS